MTEPGKNTSNALHLTSDEATKLLMVLLKTTKHREREAEACQQLSEELDDSGQPRYPNMASNAKWWKEANATIAEIVKRL